MIENKISANLFTPSEDIWVERLRKLSLFSDPQPKDFYIQAVLGQNKN